MVMALKSNILVGLDIGTTNINVTVAEHTPDGRIEVLGVGTSPSRGLRKGVVINIEATVDSIAKAIAQAESMAGVNITSVYAAISGGHVKGFNSHGIVGIKNKEVSPLDVERVIEAAKAVAIPLDREILHVLPQEFIIDEQDGIREPLGISGVRLEARVHIVTGAVASAQNVVKCANRCGLAVKDIVLAGLASGRAVVSPEEQELGVCLVDIGGGTSDVTVFHAGAVKHTSVISVGGNLITSDIAAGLRTPINAAEDIKCRFGAAQASAFSRDETIEVPSTGGRSARVLSKLVLAEIIEPRVNEIFTLLQRDLAKSGCLDYLTSGIVLTGGSANLSGIAAVGEQVFNLPVRVGVPTGVGGLTDLVKAPQYATGVGLVLHGAQSAASGRFSKGRSPLGRALARVGNWFGEHF
jgi:cell division protein FtsA